MKKDCKRKKILSFQAKNGKQFSEYNLSKDAEQG
jgi:hypothetical protein